MKKYTSIFTLLLVAFLFFPFSSCKDDDENDYEVSAEWKAHQEKWLQDIVEATRQGIYTQIKSESGKGYVYTRPSDYITNNQAGDFDKDGPEALPKAETRSTGRTIYETDIVQIRYEGWYYNLDNKKIVFDTTEKNNATSYTGAVNGFVDGFKTALLEMEVGEELIVCIPYQLAYGEYNSATNSIPGSTTLFFDIKLLRNISAEERNK